MGILDRSVGHPANWVNVAAAVEMMSEHHFIDTEVRLYFTLEIGRKPYVQIVVESTPSVFNPHRGKKPVMKHRVWELSGARPLSEGIYGLLWEVDSTVGICWPIGRVSE